MRLAGTVLWWSERDENGIIIDPQGNEFYFDKSVLKLKNGQAVKKNIVVTFSLNNTIKDCLCGKDIAIPSKSKKKFFEKRLNEEPRA